MSAFYYHNRHDDTEGVAHMAYEYIGEAYDTTSDHQVVLYRPLYPCEHTLFTRKKEDWEGSGAYVEKDGIKVPRFTNIVDSSLIFALEKISQQMYG